MKEKKGSGEKLSYTMRRTWDSKMKPKDSISISTLPPQRKTARSGSVTALSTVEKVIWCPPKEIFGHRWIPIFEKTWTILGRNTRGSAGFKQVRAEFHE
jgi:hypothetical protein